MIPTVCDYSLDSIDLIAPVYESIDGPSYGNVTITGEGLHILTCTRHPWPLSSEGFLARLNYLTLTNSVLWSSRSRDTHTCCPAFCSGAVTTYFCD